MYKITLMASALALVSCGGGPVEKPTDKLADSQWVFNGFESNVGVKQAPERYLTLGFNSANKIDGQVGCFAIKGDYSQIDKMLSIKASEEHKETSCVSAAEDSAFITQLNTAASFTLLPQTLVLDLPDGRKLNFIKKFAGCSNPLATQNTQTERLEIVPKNAPVDDLIAQYEALRPDFRIVSNAQNCSKSVIAAVNPNTLMQLRCDTNVAELIFRPEINF